MRHHPPIHPAAIVLPGLFLALVVMLGGCGRAVVQTDNPIPITTAEYDRVFNASVDVLRDFGFMPARQDRRFGVITSRPRLAASVFEPWRTDNTTGDQVLANTINHRRRTVRVELLPRSTEVGPDAPAARTNYQLAVTVELEQRQHPPRNLHTAAASSVAFYGRSGGARRVLTAAGVERSFWRPVGRDPLLEQRLIAAILTRANQPTGGAAADEPAASAATDRPTAAAASVRDVPGAAPADAPDALTTPPDSNASTSDPTS